MREKHRQERPGIASTFVIQTPTSTQLRLPPITHNADLAYSAALPGLSGLFVRPGSTACTRDAPDGSGLGVDALLGRARFCDVAPAYDAVASKKYAGQIKGVQWLSGSGKDRLEAYVTGVMASWGVSMTHAGTCVVWPEDWRALEPEALAGLLKFENCPLVDSGRAMYRYDDHKTMLARAIAWFKDWPRTGVQLDTFLESGPYQRHDGSHLCHNPLCVNPSHIVYEPTSYNIRRQECQKRASFLRTYGQDVPSGCCLHEPPCLMQHASLTMFEACAIQMSVFRQAYGLPQAPLARPPWHRYPTFEDRIPLTFKAVRADPLDLTTRASSGPFRPALICQLCSRIKGFSRVAGLWSHVRKKHANSSEEEKMQEVRRTAALWQSYLETTRSNISDPTVRKLADISREDFSWEVVESWVAE
ncbi:hypothetical protein F5Y01DRAFT_319799 [Xylaria sp. FL0043]|nr:hypothetical protein F5Y01DRAFT_319799 [Xylaria sp. FL0043]